MACSATCDKAVAHAGRIITKLVTKLNPHLEPALRSILPDIYVDCLRIALTEGVSADDRRKQITEKMIGEIEPGLTRGLNDRIDSSLVPDMWEDDLLSIVSKKVIKEFVEWTVGSLDEQLSRSIAIQEQEMQREAEGE